MKTVILLLSVKHLGINKTLVGATYQNVR